MQTYDFYVSTKVNGAMIMKGYAKSIVEAFALLAGENGFASDDDGKLYYLSNVGGTQSIICITDVLNAKLNASEKGAVNGVATLGADGKVPSSQLPAYVDDVVDAYLASSGTAMSEGWLSLTNGGTAFTPEDGKIYVVVQEGTPYTNRTYRWSGSRYVEISASIVIGTTAGTAYDGAQGLADKRTMDNHIANVTGNPHKVTKEQVGLGNTDNGAKAVKMVSFNTDDFVENSDGTYYALINWGRDPQIIQFYETASGAQVSVRWGLGSGYVIKMTVSEPFSGFCRGI